MAKKVYLLGFMGSGKTFWGARLSERLGFPYIDLDAALVDQEGLTVARIFESRGETYFRQVERDLLRGISTQETFVMSCGGGTPCFFDNIEFMNGQGITIWLDPGLDLLLERIQRKKSKRPLVASLSGDALRDYVVSKLEERRPFYSRATHRVDPDQMNPETFNELICNA
ncbi:MAG TPA: shikimate kinase [Chitinophagaceae bacterium]|nr:shikimate kinase [Chitinophagaceae bacterium]